MQTQTTLTPNRKTLEEDDDRLLTSLAVRTRVGGVTNMCLWRWTKDERVRFPQPDLVMNGRRYWRIATIKAWEASRIKPAH